MTEELVKKRIYKKRFKVSLSEVTLKQLDEICLKKGIKRQEFICDAIGSYYGERSEAMRMVNLLKEHLIPYPKSADAKLWNERVGIMLDDILSIYN